jgi:hypothetical protein
MKIAAVAIVLLCGVASRPQFMRSMNVVYAVVVGLNILTILTVK